MHNSLTKFAWLSIAGSVFVLAFKVAAYFLTGSVGLLSDALESIVNLVSAVIALAMLKVAEKPPDEDHMYGHSKAEYFSSVTEGVFIIVAAIAISMTAFNRIMHPQPIEQAFLGLGVSTSASLINLVIAQILLKAAKKHKSITLEADGHHLMTDVWTSIGVIGGIGLVSVTGIQILDPIIAILVAVNILFTGFSLIKKSALGLMDTALPEDELRIVKEILHKHCQGSIKYHGLRSRQSGMRRFVSVHILVPSSWTVQKGHDLLETIELEIISHIPKITVFTHLEPLEDPKSHQDISLDRE